MDQYTFEVALTPSSRFEVHLWPGDTEWECDCEQDACAHAFASLLALVSATCTSSDASGFTYLTAGRTLTVVNSG